MQIQHSCRSGHLNRRRETVDSKDEEIRQLVIYNQTSIAESGSGQKGITYMEIFSCTALTRSAQGCASSKVDVKVAPNLAGLVRVGVWSDLT